MRNFSMKKFGTPIPAAPGWAREKVGLARAGEPSGLTLGTDVRRFAFRGLAFRGAAVGHGGAGLALVSGAAEVEPAPPGASRAVPVAGRRELAPARAGGGGPGTPRPAPGVPPRGGGLCPRGAP